MYTDVPSAPLDIQVDDVTRDSCTVTWSPPASDGGTPVVGYHVEQRLISRLTWVHVGPKTIVGTSLRVLGLLDGQTYQFRVTAETRAGLGDPSPASAVVTARDPWTRPGPPTMPQVSDVTSKSCRVSWLPPTEDGGDEIRGYVVEYKVSTQLTSSGQLRYMTSPILPSSRVIYFLHFSCFLPSPPSDAGAV